MRTDIESYKKVMRVARPHRASACPAVGSLPWLAATEVRGRIVGVPHRRGRYGELAAVTEAVVDERTRDVEDTREVRTRTANHRGEQPCRPYPQWGTAKTGRWIGTPRPTDGVMDAFVSDAFSSCIFACF